MTTTPNLVLPYLLAAQAQKHVTHNEAIRALDCLVQLSVADRDLAAAPASPADGSRYLVASGATGAWAGQSGRIAAFQDGAWTFYLPRDGWICWVADENVAIVYDGGGWSMLSSGGGGSGGGVADHGALTGLGDDDHPQYLNNVRGDARYMPLAPVTVGINGATADGTNRLALSSPASLFNHAGSGHQIKVNKNTAANTASFLFQTGFSGRAEIGTTGDDDFHFKVSANGSTWFESIRCDRTTGRVSFPSGGVRELLTANRTYYVRTDGSDSNTGLANTAGGAFQTIQKAVDTVATLDLSIYDVTIQAGNGTYNETVTLRTLTGSGRVTILGNATTPSNIVINGQSLYCVNANSISGLWLIKGVKLTGAIIGLRAGSAYLEYEAVDFACTGYAQILSEFGGYITATGNYSISAGSTSTRHWATAYGGSIQCVSRTITITGTPAFGPFAAASAGYALVNSNTYSGSATGSRYLVSQNGVLVSAGVTLPGNTAGSVNTGGQYA